MRYLETFASAVATVALFVGISAHEAQAVDVTVDNVIGTWSNVTGPAVNLSGTGTNQIFFGLDSFDNGQSSYKFVGIFPQGPFAVGSGMFDLGTFTHINNTIGNGTSITGATLNLSIDFHLNDLVSHTLSSSFVFLHNETDNDCSGPNCSDDIVTALTNVGGSQTFNISGIDYAFAFTSFLAGGSPFVQFSSPEGGSNDAILQASFTDVQSVPGPIVGAGLPGLIAASGGFFVWVRRRRKVTEV